MLKVHILGGCGSGKTTLAQEIAAQFHIPHYELDIMGPQGPVDAAFDMDAASLENARTIAGQPGWVAESGALVWTDLLLQQANYIVILEVSWLTAVYRIIRRHIIKSLQGTNRHPGIKRLYVFLKGESKYYLRRCDAHSTELARRYLIEHEKRIEPFDVEGLRLHREQYGLDIIFGGPTPEFLRSYVKKYHQKVILVRNKADRKHLFDVLAQWHEEESSLSDQI